MPKTRSQGAASPAHELQAAPPRTRARKPNAVNPKTDLSPVANSSSTRVETTPPVAARSPITKPKDVPSPIASARIAQNSKASTTKVSHRQLLHSRSLRSAGLTHSKLLRSSKKTEELIRDQSPSPELNDPSCCVHCHRNPFDLNDAPLVAPKIVYAKTNYKDASTQSTAVKQEESRLTVPPAQTPTVKRTREESATEVEEQPASKRHQSKSTESTIQTSTQTSSHASAKPSTRVSTQTSTQTDSKTTTGCQSRSKSAPTTSKQITMASITQAKSRSKSPQFSPITRSQVGSLQITSEMTWGQMNLASTRRSQQRARQMQASQDADSVDEQSPQPSQEAAAPITPQTAPQGKTSFFGSIRKAFDFVPQLPASVANLVTNPFSPGRSTPAVESKQINSSPLQEPIKGIEYSELEPPQMPPQQPTNGMSYSEREPPKIPQQCINGMQYSESEPFKIPKSTPMVGVDMHDIKAPYSAPQEAVAGNASAVSAKRKSFSLYYDDPDFVSSDDSEEEESSAPAAKKQKLDNAQTPRSVLKKRTGYDLGTIPRTNKRVTFDDSPVDTPSKIRSRAHEYDGIHFADAPSQSYRSPSSDDETNLSNSPGTKANTEANTPFYYEPPEIPDEPGYVLPADFTPTSAHPRPGTFCLDFNTYDENDDEIDWDAPIEAIHSNVVVGDPDTPTATTQASTSAVEELAATPDLALPPATPRIAHAELPATTVAPAGITIHTDLNAGSSSTTTTAEANVLADVTQGQINKVRSTAEQHKSKNPSRLSQVERATSTSPPTEEEYSEFDAGWPKPKTYVEAGVCSQRIFEMVNKNWDPRDTAIGEVVYEQDLEEWTDAHRFEKELGIPVRYPWAEDEEVEP